MYECQWGEILNWEVANYAKLVWLTYFFIGKLKFQSSFSGKNQDDYWESVLSHQNLGILIQWLMISPHSIRMPIIDTVIFIFFTVCC